MDKTSMKKAKSLDEKSRDVWNGMSNLLDNMWWIVKIFDDYLILYFNGKHYKVTYSYNTDDEIVITENSNWIEVKEEWVAKKMQGSLQNAISKDSQDELEKKEDNDVDTSEDDRDDDDIQNEDEYEFAVSVIAKSKKKQITYSVVYEPDVVDSQGDFADVDEIEKMAHAYLSNHLISIAPAADYEHEKELSLEKAIPVESYIAPVDFTINNQLVKKGSWVLAMHIPDQELWSQVEKGEITGYSLRGKGLRIPVES